MTRDLAVQQPGLASPVARYALPAANGLHLSSPVTAFGYSSNDFVIVQARILLAVPGETLSQAIAKLNLEEAPLFRASRVVRPTVSIVAYQLPHKAIEDKLLVGCQYANVAVAGLRHRPLHQYRGRACPLGRRHSLRRRASWHRANPKPWHEHLLPGLRLADRSSARKFEPASKVGRFEAFPHSTKPSIKTSRKPPSSAS